MPSRGLSADWPLSRAERHQLLKQIDTDEKAVIQEEMHVDRNIIESLAIETRRKSEQRDYYRRRLSRYEELSMNGRRSAPASSYAASNVAFSERDSTRDCMETESERLYTFFWETLL